jgi:hypothetical protein
VLENLEGIFMQQEGTVSLLMGLVCAITLLPIKEKNKPSTVKKI